MGNVLDIAIIGYGTAGQALALLLSRDGHRVQVFERAAQPLPMQHSSPSTSRSPAQSPSQVPS